MPLFAYAVPLCLLMFVAATVAANRIKGATSRSMKARLLPKWYEPQSCKDKKHSLILHNYTIKLDKYGAEYIDVDWELTAPAQRLISFKMIVHRCPLGVGAQCEYFNTFAYHVPLCNLFRAKRRIWTAFLESMSPPLNCPVHKGPYTNRNATVDLELVESMTEGMNVEKYAWPVEFQVSSEKGLYVCFKLIVELKRIRYREQ